MDKQSVWEQIEEDQEDYQYFKQHDDEKLQQTLEAIKHEQGLDPDQHRN